MVLLCAGFLTAGTRAGEDEVDWSKEQQFWSFRAPIAPARPAVRHASWPKQELDFHVLAGLEKKGLKPSPEADRETILRRVTLDLTGLPPTPVERREFLAASGRNAYEALVDRLLASPAFGERMASLWLPLARYAEDQAHQVGDDTAYFYPNAFRYRDWVVGAFNRDLPYPDFVRMQLAADRLPGSATNELAALGFLGLGPKYYDRGRLAVMADEWEDRVDTVSRAFLGLTVACARCHDHKFDPIQREDYYALAGVFASSVMRNQAPDGAEDKAGRQDKMSPGTVHMVVDGEAKDLNVFLRGNPDRKGALVHRRFLRVLSNGAPKEFKEGSGRKELAEDIADWSNPLTARVMVNRLWAVAFGAPLVSTPSNFGHSGQAPASPELLDLMATRFAQQGGSVKALLREMVLSATYRQDSRAGAKVLALDPENALLSRMHRRRLTVEQWRDTLLAASGELQRSGGKSLDLDNPANLRRTVYARVSRLQLNALLTQFDYPDANVHAEKRASTTTATQKLFAMNSPFMMERARAFAERVRLEGGATKDQIGRAYELLYGRRPDRDEVRLGVEFLGRNETGATSRWERYAQSLMMANETLYED